MDFFLDTADIKEIERLNSTGLISGVTTNPTLLSKINRPWQSVIKDICEIVDGSVSVEVSALDYDKMLDEGRYLASIHENVTVKVPLTPNGLKVCQTLTEEDVFVNVTLCFSPLQALLAAKANASFISPFVGRLDDIGHEGFNVIHDIKSIYEEYDFSTLILGASLRNPHHVLQAALAGVDIVTIPPSVFDMLYKNPLTDSGISIFESDWKKSGQKIL